MLAEVFGYDATGRDWAAFDDREGVRDDDGHCVLLLIFLNFTYFE
jgi:hypothetical protein